MGVESQNFGEILLNHKENHAGIIKVCAKWALRLWSEGVLVDRKMDSTDMKTLGDKTYIFDHCGAYDI
jgi:hypothetical protein